MQLAHGITMGRGLEGDGVSDELFHFLWTKDELNLSPPINIPDTVFIKYGQPMVWYFTDRTGKIKRKNRQNLTPGHIETAFTKRNLGYDVVAMFITISLEPDSRTGNYPNSTIEYLDANGLNHILFSRNNSVHGVLQRFIEPKATKNEIIRAIWSPKVCLLEKGENVNHLHDNKLSLHERCVTFEGPQGYFRSSPLRGPSLAGEIQRICESLVSHISDVSYNSLQISRMVASFKVDSRDKIWLLFTTSVRCKSSDDMYNSTKSLSTTSMSNKNLLNTGEFLNLPADVSLTAESSYELIDTNAKRKCPSCSRNTTDAKCFPVSYKNLINHHEYFLTVAKEIAASKGLTEIEYPPTDPNILEATKGVGFGVMKHQAQIAEEFMQRLDIVKPNFSIQEIPPIILHFNPRLELSSFLEKCNEDEFLNSTVSVCEACCLTYHELATKILMFGNNMKKLRSAELEIAPPVITHHSVVPLTQSLPLIVGFKAQEIIDKKSQFHSKGIPSSHYNHSPNGKLSGLNSASVPSFPRSIQLDQCSKEPNVTTFEEFEASESKGNLSSKLYKYGQASYLSSYGSTPAMDYGAHNVNELQDLIEEKKAYIDEILSQQENSKSLADSISAHLSTDRIEQAPAKSQSDSKLNVYKTEIPYFVKGQKVYGSKLRKKLRIDALKKSKFEELLEGNIKLNDHTDGGSEKRDYMSEMPEVPAVISAITSGSRNHVRFLQEALDEIYFEDSLQVNLAIPATKELGSFGDEGSDNKSEVSQSSRRRLSSHSSTKPNDFIGHLQAGVEMSKDEGFIDAFTDAMQQSQLGHLIQSHM